MSFQVTRTNGGAVLKKLEKLYDIQSRGLAQKVVADKMDDIYERVFKAAPVRTGYLRSTIGRRSGDGLEMLYVTAYYARYVDQGAQGRTRNPFFSQNVVGASMEMLAAIRQLYGTL